jgi:hypothetical protein
LDRRLGGAQSRSGRRGPEKNLFPLPGFESQLLLDTSTNFVYINKRKNDMEILKTQSKKKT